MASANFDDLLEHVNNHLSTAHQNWLFGAGISFESNIPLIKTLTKRVNDIIDRDGSDDNKNLLTAIMSDLDLDANVEHYLSHLGDLIALANRSKGKVITLGGTEYDQIKLNSLYKKIINSITLTVRYGYREDATGTPVIGTLSDPIIEITNHQKFIRSAFKSRSNLADRSKINFFTLNYDTLIEDALGLEGISVSDGFSGGSVGFWNPKVEYDQAHIVGRNSCSMFKLHGSIDWQKNENGLLTRARYGAKYFSDDANSIIYPQATKYVETQKNPFAYLIDSLRKAVNHSHDNVLAISGYSFGDEHINSEIEFALRKQTNRTTIVAFVLEMPSGAIKLNPTLDKWVADPDINSRIYICGKNGIYYKSVDPIPPSHGNDLMWWKFSELSNFLSTGVA